MCLFYVCLCVVSVMYDVMLYGLFFVRVVCGLCRDVAWFVFVVLFVCLCCSCASCIVCVFGW